jgi:hypothetical protein
MSQVKVSIQNGGSNGRANFTINTTTTIIDIDDFEFHNAGIL